MHIKKITSDESRFFFKNISQNTAFLAREMIIKINFQTSGYSDFSEGHSDRDVQATDFLHN